MEIQRHRTHTHRDTIAHPAHTSVWPHTHLKRFHLLTARPVSLPADVFRGQCFFEKQAEGLRQQEQKPTRAIFDLPTTTLPEAVLFKSFQPAPAKRSQLPLIVGDSSYFYAAKFFTFKYGFSHVRTECGSVQFPPHAAVSFSCAVLIWRIAQMRP